MDIWVCGHPIQNCIFGLEVDIESKMGYLDPDLFWTRGPGPRALDQGPGPGVLDPGTQTRIWGPGPGTQTRGPDLGTWTQGPGTPAILSAVAARTLTESGLDGFACKIFQTLGLQLLEGMEPPTSNAAAEAMLLRALERYLQENDKSSAVPVSLGEADDLDSRRTLTCRFHTRV